MMRNYIKYGLIGGGLWGAVGLSACVLAGDVNAGSTDWEHTQQAVHELMRQETEKLLQQRRQQSSDAATQGPQLGSELNAEQCLFGCQHDTELLSLYGVGTDIYVQLRHAGQTYLFVPGQHRPLGHAGDSAELMIEQISGRCVRLLVADKKTQQCLLPVQP